LQSGIGDPVTSCPESYHLELVRGTRVDLAQTLVVLFTRWFDPAPLTSNPPPTKESITSRVD